MKSPQELFSLGENVEIVGQSGQVHVFGTVEDFGSNNTVGVLSDCGLEYWRVNIIRSVSKDNPPRCIHCEYPVKWKTTTGRNLWYCSYCKAWSDYHN